MSEIKIRFNTEKARSDPAAPAWRVLVDGVERLAESVRMDTEMWTSEDVLPSGETKWHLTGYGEAVWDGLACAIISRRSA